MTHLSAHGFGKPERLCSKKLIDGLFLAGHRLMVFPYSIRWQIVPQSELPEGVVAQVLIATSKKKFKHAVDRNRVKRLTRECYRLHKPQLYQYLTEHHCTLVLAVNYVHNEIFDYATLMHKFDKLTKTLIHDIEQHSPFTEKSDMPCQ